ncbi:hypothetical protein BLOT_011010 [Blomia tropicalis]|nr:hypothetical protein BLOT_011010 [Blomia tropicalis]
MNERRNGVANILDFCFGLQRFNESFYNFVEKFSQEIQRKKNERERKQLLNRPTRLRIKNFAVYYGNHPQRSIDEHNCVISQNVFMY